MAKPDMNDNPLISLKKVCAGPSRSSVLKDISWNLYQGEHWAITGPIGSGKTMLAKLLTGDATVHSGQIHYSFLNCPPSRKALKKHLRMVSFSDTGKLFRPIETKHYYQQRYNAFDASGHHTVFEYLTNHGYQGQSEHHQNLLHQMAIDRLLDLDLIKLSSGQTRRLLLCGAMMSVPEILILDNAYIGLDPAARKILNRQIELLISAFDMTVILCGHFTDPPSSFKNILTLEEGKATSISGVIKRPTQTSSSTDSTSKDSLGKIKNRFDRSPIPAGFDEVLTMKDIRIQYDQKVILEGFNWQVKTGEKWALTGNNGTGKSTILSLIYGDHPQAYANKVSLFGHPRGSGESIWDIKQKIGFSSPELHSYFDFHFSAIEIVLTGLWDGFLLKKATETQREFALELFEHFSLTELLNTPYHALSTGTQRLLFFLRALIKAPPVLLLDEPYQGMDWETIHQCNSLLNDILTDRHTLIFISHFTDEIPAIVTKRKHLE